MKQTERIQEASSMLRWETMCCCFPLRLGVFLVAVFTFLQCSIFFADREHVPFWQRVIVGGFGVNTGIAVSLLNASGVVAGLLGVLGTWFCKRAYIMLFNAWQVIAVIILLVVFVYDIGTLRTCESWVDDIQQMTKQFGWNQKMYDIAMAAECGSVRTHYFFWGVLFRCLFLYFTWCTNLYQDLVFAIPKHVLRVHKDLPVGAFYAQSNGTRVPPPTGPGFAMQEANSFGPQQRVVMTAPLGDMARQQMPNYGCGGMV
eukprot:TRINITY_DN7454_c2_g2_i1.p1 TRINITY_DN7454_c2_g2~~TRINITY_DN7454_c2_g2_i1.p1  ORF type:complete len:258 (-),score=42.73 TRINITY_DN7454_c2_g2_i1:173-946(-)